MAGSVPKVSFVITGFNAEATVVDAVTSALAQTRVDHEVVYVDDGSTDGTLKLVQEIGSARLEVVSSRHVGRAHALNLGVETARGGLIAILDADDVAQAHRAALQCAYMDGNESCMAVGGQLEAFDQHGRIDRSGRLGFPTDPDEIDMWLRGGRMPLAHPALMYRRSWFHDTGGYDSSVLRAEDFDLVLRGWRRRAYGALSEVVTRYFARNLFPSWSYWRRENQYRRAVHDRWLRQDGSPCVVGPAGGVRELVSDGVVWCAQMGRHWVVNRRKVGRLT